MVDIQERIKDVLANTTVPQDVAEALNQIEGRISSVLDGFKLLHVSCSLPISKCNIRTNSSQEHQNSGDQPANDQTQPSSPLAHSTDDQLTVATTALVELGPPTLGSPVGDSNATIIPPVISELPSPSPTLTVPSPPPSAPPIPAAPSQENALPLVSANKEMVPSTSTCVATTRAKLSTPSRSEALSAITALIQASEALAKAAKALTWQDFVEGEDRATDIQIEDNNRNVVTHSSDVLYLDRMDAAILMRTGGQDVAGASDKQGEVQKCNENRGASESSSGGEAEKDKENRVDSSNGVKAQGKRGYGESTIHDEDEMVLKAMWDRGRALRKKKTKRVHS